MFWAICCIALNIAEHTIPPENIEFGGITLGAKLLRLVATFDEGLGSL